MRCGICGYQAHEACCDGCLGHTTDGQCVTAELLDEWEQGEAVTSLVGS